jgi:hypothetical protein
VFSGNDVAIENNTIFGGYCRTVQNKIIVFIGYGIATKDKIISYGYCWAIKNKLIIFGGCASCVIQFGINAMKDVQKYLALSCHSSLVLSDNIVYIGLFLF